MNSFLYSLQQEDGIPFVGRKKSAASTLQKIETGRFKNFLDLDDLVAFSIIVPNPSYTPEIIERIKKVFTVEVTRSKFDTIRNAKIFDFDITRIVGRVPVSDPGAGDYRGRIRFEIQVRSAFEHAWSVAVHDEVYKTTNLDPRKVRLASEIKAQIETLDRLLCSFSEQAEKVFTVRDESLEQLIEMMTFLGELCSTKIVKDIQMPTDLKREAENILRLIKRENREKNALTNTVTELRNAIHVKGENAFPLSVSVHQTMVSLLQQIGLLAPQKDRCFHVTLEGESILPSLKQLNPRFSYDLI